MSRKFTLTAVGGDRTGIVSAVTEALYKHNINIEDSSMTRLGEEFAIILIMTSPDDVNTDGLKSTLKEVEDKMALAIELKELTESKAETVTGNHIITVYGADQSGIVYKTSKLLADTGVSITDLESKTGKGKENENKDIYIMVIEAHVPESLTTEELEEKLATLAKEIGVHITVKELEIFDSL